MIDIRRSAGDVCVDRTGRVACEWECKHSAGSECWTDCSAYRVSAVGHAVAVKTGSSYGPYILYCYL